MCKIYYIKKKIKTKIKTQTYYQISTVDHPNRCYYCQSSVFEKRGSETNVHVPHIILL